jgi:ppGpp synthetase/RelA/SpoT-type nucleotidyltranferase
MQSEYRNLLPRYQALCRVVTSLLSGICPANYVVAHSHRVKDFESLFAKANKTEKGKLKYKQPFTEIEDIAGFRVVVVARRNVDEVCSIIRDALQILHEENKSEQLLAEGKLGYESHHLIATLGPARIKLREYEGLCDLRFEIQVRTALQHAWAENEHRVQYKTSKKNPELVKRFLRLAGIISSADEEFDRIYEINERLRSSVATAVSSLEGSDEDEVEAGAPLAGNPLREIALMFGQPASQLIAQGRHAEAVQVYDRFIAVQPKQPSHYAGRARARALMGDIDGALADLEEANNLAPDHPAVVKGLDLLDSMIARFDDEDDDIA